MTRCIAEPELFRALDVMARATREFDTVLRREVVQVDEVQCCGFAGDKGFNRPELNEHALRHLKAGLPSRCAQGYSSSRTCEIGLSEYSGSPYRSLIRRVDRCAMARQSRATAANGLDPEQYATVGHSS